MKDTMPGRLARDATLELRVLREHLASVYAGHTTAIAAHGVFALAIGVFGYFNVLPEHRALVLGIVSAIVLMDLYVLLSKRWTPEVPLADSPRWARRYTVHVTLVSTVTAPASLFLVALQSPAMTTFVTVVIMGSWTRAVQARCSTWCSRCARA